MTLSQGMQSHPQDEQDTAAEALMQMLLGNRGSDRIGTAPPDSAFAGSAYNEPAYYGGHGYGEPAYGGPAYGEPAYGGYTYGGPAYGGPVYGGYAYGGHAYGGPAYGESAHEESVSEEPVSEEPASEEPLAPAAPATPVKKGKWLPSERATLYSARHHTASTDFEYIAAQLGRSPLACRLRLHHDRKEYTESREAFERKFGTHLANMVARLGPNPNSSFDQETGKVTKRAANGHGQPTRTKATSKAKLSKLVPRRPGSN